ncbi:hypothetical protein [Clostridium perfringens]|uniref:hypothetical protein n=1 Tax=Clostridium phage phiSM101 TaxID=396359 RepID=UPI0000DB682B|nr:hypothetical protein [Clostridium perfringens]YP_699964.1 hypothetical protein CPR_C0036 [Clostridium phage phiSM101]ABG87891.1 hypothetical protein CPR_C0036 [Clostridium phage phiSM101]MDK3122625.1 hypothetical protein [Clostridium perfringens]SQB59711.1 Uncharacterised protein [Clostridium perfringens]
MSKEYLENIEIINAYVKELSSLESKSSLSKEETLLKAGLIENIKIREERLKYIA